MKYLYKYPQSAYPYDTIVQRNRSLTRNDLEYELLDTGVFQEDRYFDVFVEYAKACSRRYFDPGYHLESWSGISQIAPSSTLWFRNNWSWQKDVLRPLLEQTNTPQSAVIQAVDPVIGEYSFVDEANVPFFLQKTKPIRNVVWDNPNSTPYVKDGINNYLVTRHTDTINPGKLGTKASLHYS